MCLSVLSSPSLHLCVSYIHLCWALLSPLLFLSQNININTSFVFPLLVFSTTDLFPAPSTIYTSIPFTQPSLHLSRSPFLSSCLSLFLWPSLSAAVQYSSITVVLIIPSSACSHTVIYQINNPSLLHILCTPNPRLLSLGCSACQMGFRVNVPSLQPSSLITGSRLLDALIWGYSGLNNLQGEQRPPFFSLLRAARVCLDRSFIRSNVDRTIPGPFCGPRSIQRNNDISILLPPLCLLQENATGMGGLVVFRLWTFNKSEFNCSS